MDARVTREADVVSDQHLLLGTLKVKLRVHSDSSDRPH